MSFRVNINTIGSVVDHKIRMRASETNSGHRAVGLDTLIAPIKRELSGAQGNLLETIKRKGERERESGREREREREREEERE
uniref:Uncharacterized protein n=1 Tax=Glossina morsitans morsitans TaxID=37546 RepID=A0A1B0FRL1_GLOMM